ncbi:MAG: hypothetical protein WC783_04460 [Candidatus Paceibacterota bacterium]|jgi:hypothetical protein
MTYNELRLKLIDTLDQNFASIKSGEIDENSLVDDVMDTLELEDVLDVLQSNTSLLNEVRTVKYYSTDDTLLGFALDTIYANLRDVTRKWYTHASKNRQGAF